MANQVRQLRTPSGRGVTSFASALTGLSSDELQCILSRLPISRRGRPWARSLRKRLVIVCTALRTNLTIRELGALCFTPPGHRRTASFAISCRGWRPFSVSVIRTGAARGSSTERSSPPRDHAAAARSKNYRWSCNALVLIRRRDVRVIAVSGGGPGNRIDPIHYRGSNIETLRREHAAYSPTAPTEQSRNSSLLPLQRTGSCAMRSGAVIESVARASSTLSRGSRTGAFYEIIAAAAAPSHTPSRRSRSSTTSGSSRVTTYGTALSRSRRRSAPPRTRAAPAARAARSAARAPPRA